MPEPCEKCGMLYGYHVHDNCMMGFTHIVLIDGDNTTGSWSDYVKTTKEGKRAYCAICDHDLKLKIDRS